MKRSPRNPEESLFSLRSLSVSILQGLSVLAVVLGVFIVSRILGYPEDRTRTLTFVTLVIANLCLILTNRSWSRTIVSMMRQPNGALWWVVGGATAFIAAVLSISALRGLFHFAPVNASDILICALAGIGSVVWFELLKMFSARQNKISLWLRSQNVK